MRLFLLAMVFAAAPAAARPTNVLLISVDTLNRAALRAFNPDGEALPGYDALAAESLRFTHATSTSSWTLPAHASALTGLYPWRHGGTHSTARLQAPTTLAAELRRHGYRTIAFTDGGFVGPEFGFLAGFDLYDGAADGAPWPGAATLPRGGGRADSVAVAPFDRAVAFIQQQRAEDPPFFLFAHTYQVHDYFQAPRCTPAPSESEIFNTTPGPLDCLSGRLPCASEWPQLRLRYDAEVAYNDRALTALLAALDRAGLREQTLVVLMSDHGEGFDPAHGRIHHGGRLHQDLVRIPLLVRGPGVEPGALQAPFSLVDLMPTLLAALGLSVPDGLDGHVVALAPAAGPGEPRLASVTLNALGADGVRGATRTAIMDADWWYIDGAGREELYDMRADPLQFRNLAPAHPELARMRAAAALVGRPPTAPAAILDAAGRERLRVLGY